MERSQKVTQQLGTEARPLRVAVIGAGPAGFYAAEALLKEKDLVCSIDIYNRFPYPYGLVRDGVAPDHQSIKAVTRIYDRILNNPQVRYFGNITFGEDLLHQDMKQYYDQIVYAVGAQSDRRMGIAGEDLCNSMPATAFVGWYNGHPDYCDLNPDLSCERVIVVGNGNVAMDVTRILASSPDELAKTDMADHAVEHLRQSKVREVVMLGRRGPAQAAFTNPELKEFGELPGVDVIVDPADLELDEQSARLVEEDKKARNNVEMLRAYAANTEHTAPRRIRMRFYYSPVEVLGKDGNVSGVVIERNTLVMKGGRQSAQGTGQYETMEAGMVLRSVGYRGVPLPGVPFDESSHTISNVAGRVMQVGTGDIVEGEYVVGWAKRGPSGVIGTNKPDSVATVKAMIEDIPSLSGIDDAHRDPVQIEKLLAERNIQYVTYDGWQTLNQFEVARGEEQGRPRIKLTRVPEMLQVCQES
jgi:ferredoxin--NADP+ reductase